MIKRYAALYQEFQVLVFTQLKKKDTDTEEQDEWVGFVQSIKNFVSKQNSILNKEITTQIDKLNTTLNKEITTQIAETQLRIDKIDVCLKDQGEQQSKILKLVEQLVIQKT